MRCHILFFLAFAFAMQICEGYRILCLLPFQGKSHFVMFEALCQGLAKRGHQIDMISHYPSKKPIPNYTDIIDLTGTVPKIVNNFTIEFGKHLSTQLMYHITTTFGSNICEIMGHEKMQNFIKNPPNDPPYDLLIIEMFGSPCYFGLGPYLKAPVVIVVTTMDMPIVNDFMGNPMSYASFPGIRYPKGSVDTFYDRLANFVLNFRAVRLFHHYTMPLQTEMMRKYLGQDLPTVEELETEVSLALINGHHSFYGIRPMIPSMVEIAGIHIEHNTQQKMNPGLQSWMDSADQGVVYFSMGSLLKIDTFPKETILELYAAFAKIAPVKVLMKCNNVSALPSGMPQNIHTLSWIPQMAVLKHNNTRAFITHGGLMGTQEALYNGVPVIGLPIFGDQMKNVGLLQHKNMAYLLDIYNINQQAMTAALNAVLYNPKYAESAKKMSKLFRDRPMSAMDTAAYWIEYIIRNGPDTLKSPTAKMPWWKKSLLDVFAFLGALVALAIGLLIFLVKLLLKLIRGSNEARHEKKLK